MLQELLSELVELYLRRARVSDEQIVAVLHQQPDQVAALSRWLLTAAPRQLCEEALDECDPLEW